MRKIAIGVGVICALLGAAEIFARKGLGLGDPPLSVADEKIEYLFAPNQECHRFGNRIRYNNVSLRNDYDTDILTNGCKVVLMLGDSVLNGGALTDQDRLATVIAERDLRAQGHDVRILNCSAGSWGPVNCAEYVRKYGDFGASQVWMLLNPGDLWDVPDYTPIVGTSSFPDKRPISAAGELVVRYLWPRAQSILRSTRKVSRLTSGKDLVRGGMEKEQAESASLEAIRYCLGRMPTGGKGGIVYSRLRTDWSRKEMSEAESKVREFCKRNGYEFFLLELDPETDYRDHDDVHVNDRGQKKLARLIERLVAERL